MEKPQVDAKDGASAYRDPYPEFLDTAEEFAVEDSLFASRIIRWEPYDELSSSTHADLNNLYYRWGFNYHNVFYLQVDEQLEKQFPHLKFAQSWAKYVIDSGLNEKLPIQIRTRVLIFLREQNINNDKLVLHELAHPLADAISEQVEGIRQPVMMASGENINPQLFPGAEITLWEDLFREGLAILFEPENTLIFDDYSIATRENGWGGMTVYDHLMKVKASDKLNDFTDSAIQVRKMISAIICGEQIRRFADLNRQTIADEPEVWNLPKQLKQKQVEQQDYYRAMMSLTVQQLIDIYSMSFAERRKIILDPTLKQVGECAPKYPWDK